MEGAARNGTAAGGAGKEDDDIARSPPATTPPPPPPPPPPPVRDASWWRARGFPGPVGLDNLSLWRAITFSWASPLIDRGAKGQFTEETAEAFLARRDDPAVRAAAFERAYAKAKARAGPGSTHVIHRALLSLHWREMLLQTLWLFAESGTRIGSALSLRSLLGWLSSPDRDASSRSLREGWARASALVFCTLAFLVIHHQLFWVGMHTGYRSRLEVTCAIHSKLLKLSSAALAASAEEGGTEGKDGSKKKRAGDAVNLASSDVRRLDDAGVFWPFLLVAPLELAAVFGLLAARLGPAAAAAGCAPLIAFVPGQALVSRRIGALRASTAARTDARARAAAEAVNGALTVKMLAAGGAVLRRLFLLRKLEEKPIRKMAAIRATNMSLYFMSFPVAAFLMFATVAATRPPRDINGVELPSPLTVPNVFYALALLRLPVLYLGIFFVTAVEKVAELAASLKRLDAFLALPEPPPPAHLRGRSEGDDESDVAEDVAVAFRGADFDWGGKCGGGERKGAGEEEVAGASRVSFEGSASGGGGGEAAAATPSSVSGPTLKSITLHVKRGELLGIAGPVGSGKSSLLLALLSELLPCPAASSAASDADADAATREKDKKKGTTTTTTNTGLSPVVRGSLAYCSQVPWIPPGTLRDAILFGSPYDSERYERSVDAAALRPDLEALPAGDLTEIGERGVNLSGGQRARVALARAAYADADVVLLDDPLSALDARVGAAVFERCIANGSCPAEGAAAAENPESSPPSPPPSMMAGKTRLLVTHARHYLPRCDRVAVVRNGEVVALGTPAELAERGVPELVAAVREAAASASGGVDVDAAADAAANEDDDQEGAGAAIAAITSTHANDVEAAGELSDWDASSRPQTPAAPLSSALVAGSEDVAAGDVAPASSVAAGASVAARARSAAASRLRRAISKNLRGGGRGAKAEERGGDDIDDIGGRGSSSVFGGVGGGSGSTLGRGFGSLRLAASRRFRGGGGARDPALATVGDAAAEASLYASGTRKGGRNPDAAGDRDSERLALGALVKAEGRAEGGVGGRVYASWAARLGGGACALVAVGLLAGQGAYLFAEYWVSILSPSSSPATAAAGSSSTENLRAEIAGRKVSQSTWLEVYGALTAAICLLGAARALVFFDASVKAATSLHASMVRSLVGAPLAFFHTTPAGRILNRLTKDQGIADDYLPSVAFDSLQSVFMAIGALTLLVVAVPFVAPVLIPLGAWFAFVRARYLAASRDVKRLDGTTRSPVFAMLAETPRGLPTIRAYAGARERLEAAFNQAAGRNVAWWGAFVGCARWVGFRIDGASSAMLVAETALVVALPASRVSPRLAGLALVHAISLSGSLQWAVRQTAEWEVSMTSVERMLELCHLPTEEDEVGGGGKGGGGKGGPPPPPQPLPADAPWPTSGALELQNVSAIYRSGLPPVLRGVSFSLPSGCRAGVVGRSGSGKSSLVLALFRMIPLTGGRVLLGGVDVSSMPLERLRSALAVIPQDPFLFAGTVRTNLNPLAGLADCGDGDDGGDDGGGGGGGGGDCGENGTTNNNEGSGSGRRRRTALRRSHRQQNHYRRLDDAELWAALEAVGLKAAVRALPGRLDAAVAGGGENLSVGQRQLLCAARALLRRPALLIADEATANVDAESDAAIQAALRRGGSGASGGGGVGGGCFGEGTTVLTIAHRLDTVMTCDTVLVFGSGKLLENGPPAELARKSDPPGPFARLVAAAERARSGGKR